MKKEDKQQIYDLLKKVDAYVSGFTNEAFAGEVVFEDDKENPVVEPVETTTNTTSGGPSRASGTPENTITVETTSGVPEPVEGPGPQVDNAQADMGSLSPSKGPENTGLTLDDLKAKILRCTKCPLARTRNNVVPGEGVEHPDVLVIGEGPGYDEDMSGRPFVGKEGDLLDKMLAAIELDRTKNCYIANVVKCRPPNNRDPEPSEQSACEGFLQAQIHILKPKMILCMGRIAGHKMLDTQSPLGQMRGQLHDYNGIPLMVTYHPSALLRDESLKAPAWEDLKAFRRHLNEIKSQ